MTVIQQDRTTNVPLGSIASSTSARAEERIDVPVYSVTKHRGFVPSAEYFSKQVFSRELSNYKLISSGDFAYATIHLDEGSIGIAPEDALVSPMYTSFRVDHSLVDADYLVRFLKSPRALATYPSLGKGSAERRRSISFQRLSELQVPLPPLPEQRRIAAILDKADLLRAQRREALAHLDVLSESLFLSTFGSPNTTNSAIANSTLGEVAEIIVPTRDKPTQFGGPIPWVTLPDLESTFISHAKYTVSAGSPNVLTNRLIPGRSVLLSCAGTVGKVAITLTAVHANQQFYGIVPNRTIVDETYLAFALKLRGSAFFGQLAGSFTIAFFSKIKAVSIPIAIPLLEMQQNFARRVVGIERLKEQHRAQLAELDTLFASLQYRAFRGEL